jgi:hypothetical protein
VSVVMALPLTGPMLLESLRSQDMYLAGSFLMFMAFLTVVGVFISDILLALLDPRIRLGSGASNERGEHEARRPTPTAGRCRIMSRRRRSILIRSSAPRPEQEKNLSRLAMRS